VIDHLTTRALFQESQKPRVLYFVLVHSPGRKNDFELACLEVIQTLNEVSSSKPQNWQIFAMWLIIVRLKTLNPIGFCDYESSALQGKSFFFKALQM